VTDFGFTRLPYVLDARKARRSTIAVSGDGRITRGVMLLSRAHDSELDAVAALLSRANVPHLRVNADHLHDDEVFLDPATGQVSLNGALMAPTVTWIRHFAATAIPRSGQPVADRFSGESWMAAASLLAAMSGVTIAAGRPSVAVQLRLAAQLGVLVPRTVVTNDLAWARRTIGSRRLVVKAAHQHFVEAEPGLLSGLFPAVMDRERLNGRTAHGAPVIVQEYVEHDIELRVYRVGGQLECFEVSKASPADPWLAPDQVTARLVATPPGVARDVRRLAAAMSLRFAAFDFLLRDGRSTFLEANPDGDWRWLEAKAGQWPVTAAAGRMLSGLHHTRCPGSAPFNLLTFLSGDPRIPPANPSP
jgi:hypothetical protein